MLPAGHDSVALAEDVEDVLCARPGLVGVAKASGTSTERLHEAMCGLLKRERRGLREETLKLNEEFLSYNI